MLVELPQSTPADIAAAFDRARAVQAEWSQWPLRKRLKVFKKFHTLVINAQEQLADLIQGRVRQEPPDGRRGDLRHPDGRGALPQARRDCSPTRPMPARSPSSPDRPRSASRRVSWASSRPGTSPSRRPSPTRSPRSSPATASS
ncbi:aldehyde dehydrogenase family protein [Nocardioides sp. B-3]|uniref:aldehyde dehydrogenase family protein n=1 Tax=Nocardioides sp. B-3 TaxID=2895565 RepID=UPI0021537ED3|nr:aldehyde dehydrogenase family protein [Nocardioides sp. B-3]